MADVNVNGLTKVHVCLKNLPLRKLPVTCIKVVVF